MNFRNHITTTTNQYRLYINDRYLGTYDSPQEALAAAKDATGKFEIWKTWENDSALQLLAKGWN